MKEKNSMIDMTRANRLGLRLELIIIVILTICYVIQGGKNSITVPSLIILLLTLWVPVILARLVFKKEQDSELIKHIIGIGYGIFYIAVCVLSDQQLVFTYAFPMLIVVTIYCDMKFSITVGSAVCVISLLHGIVCTMRAGFSDVAIAALEIQIAATVLIAVYSVLGNQFIIQITKEHLDKINDAAKKTEVMMDSIMDVSNALADEVDNVSDKMHMLETSSQEINTAMQEVSSGSNETAESVQNQLVKTEEIQTQINRVTEVAESIGSDVANTVEACNEGRGNINELLDKSKISEKAGVTVASEVEALKDATEKMESIVSLIKSVASQTSLLALNASIEAARAGEAGKGFAVVASEISSLADQTQTATGNISELITSISTVVTEVVDSINSLVENNRSQNESANITNGSFEKIIENIQSIRVNSNELTGVVSKLAGANQEIVESIQTISAITEQVSAHSSNTCETAENNEAVVEEIIAIVQKMNENAEQLAKLSV